jgi:hypothetical protein
MHSHQQRLLHPPQFWLSLVVSTQLPLHSVRPAGHPQTPPEQLKPGQSGDPLQPPPLSHTSPVVHASPSLQLMPAVLREQPCVEVLLEEPHVPLAVQA